MKRKTLFKRLSSVAMALLLSLSALTQGITASAFSDTNKATQQWLNETYAGTSGYSAVDEDGITGMGTIRALIWALQTLLGKLSAVFLNI